MIGRVSETLDVDVQGRIRISDNLLDHIGVDRDVVIIGAMNRLQIWAAGSEPSFDEAFTKVASAARTVLKCLHHLSRVRGNKGSYKWLLRPHPLQQANQAEFLPQDILYAE